MIWAIPLSFHLFFTLSWIVMYPSEYFDGLTFNLDDGLRGTLVSIGVWVFLVLAVTDIILWTKFVVDSAAGGR